MELPVVDAHGSEEKTVKTTKRVSWRSPLHEEETTKEPDGGVDEAKEPNGGVVEATETLVVDAAASEERGRKTKMVTWRSPPHMEEVLINELIGYMVAMEPLHTFSEFDLDPDHAQILACFMENKEYKANVLQQYRTNGYAELQLQLEVTDDELEEELVDVEELAYDPGEVLTFTYEEEKTKIQPNGDEAMEVLDADGSVEERGAKRKKTNKPVTWRLSRELLDYLRTKEVMGCIATEMPRLLWPNITAELFDQKLRKEIAAQFEENREFDAYVLYQYRTKGYADIQEEVDDDEL